MAELVGSIDGARREAEIGESRRSRSLDLPSLTISSFKAPKISMSRHRSFASVAAWFYLTSLDSEWHDSLHLHAYLPARASPIDAVRLALTKLQETTARTPSTSNTQECPGNWVSEHEWGVKGDHRYPCLRRARITVAVPDTQPLRRNEVEAYAERRIGQIVQGFVDASRGRGDSALVAAANIVPSVEVAESPAPPSRGRSVAIGLLCSVLLMGVMYGSLVAFREYGILSDVQSQLEALPQQALPRLEALPQQALRQLEALRRVLPSLAERPEAAPAPFNASSGTSTPPPGQAMNPPPPKPAVPAARAKLMVPPPKPALPTPSHRVAGQ